MQRPFGAKTEMKNPELIVHEEVEYTIKLRKRHYEATYIFDIDKMDFELNKVDNFTVDLCLKHLQKHFPNPISQYGLANKKIKHKRRQVVTIN